MGKIIPATRTVRWKRRILVGLLLSAAFLVTKIPLKLNRPQISEIKSTPVVAKSANLDEDTRILSLQVHTDDVFASTAVGLFRATKSERKWERLPTPATMPLGGSFARQPAGHDRVYYHASALTKREGSDTQNLIEGLYRSDDLGQSWHAVNTEHRFKEVFLHPSGDLYAIIVATKNTHAGGIGLDKPPLDAGKPPSNRIDRIYLSHDAGTTWMDISSDLSLGLRLYHIFQDPDHPDLVCLRHDGFQAYVLQANDKNNKWNEIKEAEWRRTHETSDTFFHDPHPSNWVYHFCAATLSNYFEHPFGETIEIPALRLTTDQPEYRFKKGDTVAMHVEVSFIGSQPEVKIIDLDASAGLWGMKRILPDGQKSISPPKALKSAPPVIPGSGSLSDFRAAHQLKTHLIGGARTYRRLLNLSALEDFPKAGTYRVQLFYSNDGIADRALGEWGGGFACPVFEITIEE
jgi:hypothetical protein